MKRFISREELSTIMQQAGLSDIQVYDLNFGTVCIHLGIRNSVKACGIGPELIGSNETGSTETGPKKV
jgi:hypothetical protein